MKKLLKYKKNYIILILIALVLLSVYFSVEKSMTTVQPIAKQGYLDLSNWNFEKDGIISLDGKWEFYWNQLLTYDDFHAGTKELEPDGYVSVPSVWNSYSINGKTLPGAGFATYRLRIKGNEINQEMGLKIANMSTAYRLMVNNDTIATNGTVSSSPANAKAEYRPQASVYKTPSGDYEIIIQISNYTYARGGLWYSIFMGTSQQIQDMKENASRREMFIFGGIIMMMLYHLAIYIFQRKNISILYYVLMMLIIAARIPVTGEYMISQVFQGAEIRPLVIVEYLTICWAPVTWLLFINRFYPEEISKRVVYTSVYIGLVLTVFTLLVPIRIFTAALWVYELIVVVLFIYALFRFITAVARKREGVVLMLLATAAFFGTFVNDALYQWNIISSRSGGIFGFSAFVIIFIQAYVLAAQFSSSYRKVEELSDSLLSLDRLKDEFLANTSHELRTPLNGIINITNSVIESSDKKLDEAQRQNLEFVILAARRLYNLINDILDISSLKNGEINLYKRPVDLRSVAEHALYVLSQMKGSKTIEFINNISEELPPVDADVERLRQIFYNLIGNALKFTEHGKIEVGASVRKNDVEVWVEDTGCGIPRDKLKDIFKPFYQIDSTITRDAGGTGLGLSITKTLVELHKGSIRVSSEEGVGSKFIFTLPISDEQTSSAFVETSVISRYKASDVSVLTTTGEMKKRPYSILAVDDDPASLTALFNILDNEGYYVKAVTNGEDVEKEIDELNQYNLVILDVMMPKISGYEVLKKIRMRFQPMDVPVLMLTAKARAEDFQAGFAAGANDYLAKPFEAIELKARVHTLVQLKESVSNIVETELSFLQAQIKPHFIYNSLSVIAALTSETPEKAKELLYDLTDYLRGSFRFNNYNGMVPLSEELATVKAYISIERARFEEKLEVEYDIDDTLSVSLPMLTLQPIVENAVRHGLFMKPEGGYVRVNVYRENEDLVISVEDNGGGISTDTLEKIFSDHASLKGVGLKNINRRLKIFYGKGLHIKSEVGKGTEVSFRIPIENEEQE